MRFDALEVQVMPGEEIRNRLAREEERLRALERERSEAQGRIEVLRRQLAETRSSPPPREAMPEAGIALAPRTPAEKVRLFRALFRGRQDVFPRLWVNAKSGKRGYAPACSNEWAPGLCGKPQVRCGECPHQAFIPVEDRVILDHLQGRHVIGVYPLLEGDTCWFLAADFDKRSWREDAAAFLETCRQLELPAALERSRSGDGAHVWFFFTAVVEARTARRMACFLITETMSRRHELAMTSYDRLFPNQDTLPRGGFGNLIALPLQHEPRSRGNTVFLDERFEPYADQWAYLASIRRLDPARVEAIAGEAARRGKVIGIRFALAAGEAEEREPWTRPPSGRSRPARIEGPLPSRARAILAQRLFVEKEGLPPALLNEIKRLAAFQNPEFYRRQGLRLSVALTPRVIACAEDFPEHVSLPRGCRSELHELLRGHGVDLAVEDHRQQGVELDLRFRGRLTPLQEEAARALLEHDTGVFVAPPGIGKTVLGTYLIARRSTNTLVLVHRRPLLEQWLAQLSIFLGLDEKEIGRIGAGKRTPNGRLDVAMIQSLGRRGRIDDLVADYGQVIADECHHIPAVSFERVLSEVKARYLLGLTATPQRRDGQQPITAMQLGPVRFAVDPRDAAARRPFEQRLVVRESGFALRGAASDLSIQEVYRALAEDDERNRLIIDDVIRCLEDGRSPILLTERRDHLELLAGRLSGFARHLFVLQGGLREKERRKITERLAAVPDGEERLVLATGRYIGEGFDDARLIVVPLARILTAQACNCLAQEHIMLAQSTWVGNLQQSERGCSMSRAESRAMPCRAMRQSSLCRGVSLRLTSPLLALALQGVCLSGLLASLSGCAGGVLAAALAILAGGKSGGIVVVDQPPLASFSGEPTFRNNSPYEIDISFKLRNEDAGQLIARFEVEELLTDEEFRIVPGAQGDPIALQCLGEAVPLPAFVAWKSIPNDEVVVFPWDVKANLGERSGIVRIILTPVEDGREGRPEISRPFRAGNRPVELTELRLFSNRGLITAIFQLADRESDTIRVQNELA
jgi:hypothetical protein